MTNAEIKVGTPGAWQIGSDRYPIIVTQVITPRKIVIEQIDFQCDFSGYATQYFPEKHYSPKTLTLRKNGRFVEQGQPMKYGGGYGFGEFSAYRDPSF